jgi:hypothetical protein
MGEVRGFTTDAYLKMWTTIEVFAGRFELVADVFCYQLGP